MNRSLLTLAVLGIFVGGASAQSSVTLYGKVDVGVTLQDDEIVRAPDAKTVRVDSGISGGSRLGFRGVEDLGGGMKARFQLETGLCSDGASDPDNQTCGGDGQIFGRMAIVALDGGFGSVVLGRQFTSSYLHLDRVDPFGTGLAGAATNMFPFQQRLNNAVAYSTPAMGGISATVAYAAGEQTGNKDIHRIIDGVVSYSAGPLYVGIAFERQSDEPSNEATDPNSTGVGLAEEDTQILNVGATYDFGFAKGYLQHQITESDIPAAGMLDQATTLIGVSVPLGRGNLMASYIRHNDKTTCNPGQTTGCNLDADQVGLGYMYALSKRTQLYTAFARISNDNGATKTVGDATAAGTGERAMNFGVVHNF